MSATNEAKRFTERSLEEHWASIERCPKCGSDDIAEGDVEPIGETLVLRLRVTCRQCGHTWKEE